ncbi:efflux RND transporter permease subunit [Tautonia plasticadhaerens]|uniref:Efflux pump membrane transporter BepE n=1 Tax=Tautonia plasticadhaerens TaxID=2527974 RepID=A0A518GUG1_9BACT|nr:multidrug efflux RND transporter permease subunit [Tautonia plasticadhaerens]QDV32223.1 Efflux pump membrane transporter BepE [Tautonia plasticadhaerens]
MSRFFIDRPIFANVIAIVTMIFGAVALLALPIEQYPEITPPTVQVRAVYPGASAQVVADTVAAPIEQQVNGVEDMLYMQSTSSSDGSYSLTVTFEVGTDLDQAQVLVQNRISAAEPLLPEEVRRQGVTAKKQSTNIILVINLLSPDNTYDSLFMSNYASLRIRDELSRIDGVGDARSFGSTEYSMRIWLDPEKLKARNLTTQDILRVLREQNVQVAAGAIGQSPAPEGQNFQLTISALGRLSDAEQFEQIVVKGGEGTRVTYLRDVARVELGAQTYDQYALKNAQPTASIAIFQLPGANALQVADDIRATIERLSEDFPQGMTYDIPFDTTLFVRESIREVYKTLFEAGVLVLVVILVFLQDWRGVLIPATTVPVTIVGAFTALALLGFTVNMLTLFGLVLAIGIVVDDAIVIVENAAHHIERGRNPRDATIRAMGEVTGPIIGITLVLMAVFVPTAFLGGITGQLYRQFALTIAATAIISAINALTLKPAQSASLLRPLRGRKNFFFRAFNWVYDRFAWVYLAIVKGLVRVPVLVMLLFFGVVAGTVYLYASLPTGFLPVEDQGYAISLVQLPDGASLQRTSEVVDEANDILMNTPGVENVFAIAGFSLLDSTATSNAATFFVVFEPFEERHEEEKSMEAILGSIRGQYASRIKEAVAMIFPPPSIRGLGTTGGFQLQLEDKGAGLQELARMVQQVQADAGGQSSLQAVTSTFRAGVPQLYADVDRVKAKTMDLDLNDVFGTMQASLGSAYVNDFNKFGRTYQVRVQADERFRSSPEDIRKLEVRNLRGEMVPLGAIVDVKKVVGPQIISRYNLYPTAAVTGEAAPGYSSGDALTLMEQMLARNLPPGMGYEWTGMSFQEKRVSGQSVWVFGLAVLFVYLVLAAQYESWLLPAAVIFVVPLGLLGAATAVALRGFDNNVYTQIGIVLIIALASKNAILIVEFARDLHAQGKSIREAAVEAAGLRFRPILMTSFAFILGVWPLVNAEGAGAASRQALGTAVFGGMIASTLLAVFVVPVFFVVFQWLAEFRPFGRRRAQAEADAEPAPTPEDDPAPHRGEPAVPVH